MVLALLASVVTLVNPFIGTKGTDHCFPGAARPFGAYNPKGVIRW